MRIVVGSQALDLNGCCPRQPVDVDVWTDETHTKEPKIKGVELSSVPIEILQLIPTKEAYVRLGEDYESLECCNIASADTIYTIKLSHIIYDIHWDKTVADVIYLQRIGCKLIPELHTKLCEFWKTVHGNKEFLNLNRTKEEFFNDYVKKEYDHDWLHEIVAESNVPLYTKCLKDNQEVLIDHEKFKLLSKPNQIRLFREEMWVIALERWLIPTNFKIPVYKAYRFALRKTATKLTKGWATQFIIDNIKEYVRMGGTDWYTNFLTTTGKVTTMTDTIAKVQEKADEFGLSVDQVERILFFDELMEKDPEKEDSDWYKKHPEYLEAAINEFKFATFLKSIGYESIEQHGGKDLGTSAYTVIKLDGKLFRTDYGYQSYDGYYIDDVWDWNEVEAKEKKVTVYE